MADGSDVTLEADTGSFDVVFSVTPDTAGSLVNPDSSGVCQVDPDDEINEDDETNNDCTDTVTVLDKPDLQVMKANDTGGTEVVGTTFDWTVTISNTGGSDATFTNSQTIFQDDLPNTGASYGTPSAQNFTNISNSGSIDCNIAGTALTCTADGADVILGATTGEFDVVFGVTPDTAGSLVNPDSAGSCQVDPDDQIKEDDETNNDCTDTVTVLDKPDLQVLKANDTGGTGVVGTAFDWTITLSNVGASDATFADGQIMFRDDLPSTAASYGTPIVQNVTDITNSGNVDCNIVGTALTCMANGADVTFGAATGSFDVAVEVTPSATVNLNNPDPNGICQVDPDDHVAEGDENDNDCADTVTVTAAGGDGGGDDDDEGSGRPSRNCPVGVPGGICRLKNLVKVVVFENTVSDGSYILIQEKAGGHFQLSGRVFDVTIVGPGGGAIPTFDPPIEVCLRPSNAELKAAGWHYGNLSLFHSHAGGPWEAIYNTYEQDGKVCAKVGQLSLFALGVAPLPDTGFSPGVKHALPAQPAEKAYAASGGFKLEIPSLGIELPIVGVPLTADGWDVRWLEGQAGWLHGTAFPTWTGNTAITAHVWDADNNPGPFVDLNTLQHGDEIIIHAWGLTHTYEVRDVEQVRPDDLRALPHEDYDVLTLLTCQGFDEDVGAYDWRLAVRAVLLGIEAK
jgi:LPXTG-site transpeptidase (sortase) family protein